MQNAIFIAKISFGSAKNKAIIIDISNAEIIQICNIINILLKYNFPLDWKWGKHIVNLGLQNIKKHCGYKA